MTEAEKDALAEGIAKFVSEHVAEQIRTIDPKTQARAIGAFVADAINAAKRDMRREFRDMLAVTNKSLEDRVEHQTRQIALLMGQVKTLSDPKARDRERALEKERERGKAIDAKHGIVRTTKTSRTGKAKALPVVRLNAALPKVKLTAAAIAKAQSKTRTGRTARHA